MAHDRRSLRLQQQLLLLLLAVFFVLLLLTLSCEALDEDQVGVWDWYKIRFALCPFPPSLSTYLCCIYFSKVVGYLPFSWGDNCRHQQYIGRVKHAVF